MRKATPILLATDERRQLERWARGRGRRRRRAKIILLAAEGKSTAATARALRTDRACVARWRARFAQHRLAGIQQDAPRSGRPPKLSEADLRAIVTQTTTTTPGGVRPWSTRTLARWAGVSPKSIHRIWQANGLSPHRGRPLRFRHVDAEFAGLAYVVGRYLTPLDSALILAGDSETWQPCPLPPAAAPGPNRGVGREPESPQRRTGVPARYGDLQVPTGHVIGFAPKLSRHLDWLHFLERLAERIPAGLQVHIVADTAVAHQHPDVQDWVDDHPAIRVHLVGREQFLPARLARLLRTVSAIFGQPPPRPRQRGRTLRSIVEAFSPPSSQRTVSSWVATEEMTRVFCGGLEPGE